MSAGTNFVGDAVVLFPGFWLRMVAGGRDTGRRLE